MEKVINRIVCGDCIEVLGRVREPFADLIFADPPFNIGYKYDKYYDKVKSKNYITWTKEWMAVCKKVLKPHGSFYIAIGDEHAADVKRIADELGLFMRNWLIWHYSFGQQMKNKFSRSHTHIFYFVKDKNEFTFNDYAVRIPSERQLIYNDRRANPEGKMPDDVWSQFPRLCGTFRERARWHPCQMPENVLKRIVAASSNLGDCVLDPFSGSGTTVAAAYQLGRNYLGIELSEEYVENARERLATLKRQKSLSLPFDRVELNEIKQLLLDMQIPAVKISEQQKLLALFTNQFSVRMRNKRYYKAKDIAAALRDLAH